MYAHKKSTMGSLELIIGPMFAGKSSAIIRIVNRYRSIGYPMLLISHSSDTRYSSQAMVVNHDNVQVPCLHWSDLMSHVEEDAYKDAKLVIIEEAQFFPRLREFVVRAVDVDRKDVIVVGLDGDADRKPFGEILELVPLADRVEKVQAFCADCSNGTEALFSYCKKAADRVGQVCVGGADTYMPLCREHYVGRSGHDKIMEVK
jgi:thymidine kinase